MGVAMGVVRVEPDPGQEIDDAIVPFAARQHAGEDRPRLAHDLGHRHAGVQRGEGVLEDDLETPAREAHLALVERKEVLAGE